MYWARAKPREGNAPPSYGHSRCEPEAPTRVGILALRSAVKASDPSCDRRVKSRTKRRRVAAGQRMPRLITAAQGVGGWGTTRSRSWRLWGRTNFASCGRGGLRLPSSRDLPLPRGTLGHRPRRSLVSCQAAAHDALCAAASMLPGDPQRPLVRGVRPHRPRASMSRSCEGR